jgi:voltage-gated potassium channel
MFAFKKLKEVLLKHFMALRWYNLVVLVAAYAACAWGFLFLAGEEKLTQPDVFFYWLVVTASSVGYGDFSPSTAVGRAIATLYVIPCGIGLFALTIGQIASSMAFYWRKSLQGLKMLQLEGHIVVLGWSGTRTLHLLDLLLREQVNTQAKAIVLVAQGLTENPLPGHIHFVQTSAYNSEKELDRACILSASTLIIDTPSDDITMTAALLCHSKNAQAHCVAFFNDETLGSLLTRHCPGIEITPSVSVEMLAKAAMDPGSSHLHHQLLNAHIGMSQYSLRYPEHLPERRFEEVFLYFKRHHQATVIGVNNPNQARLQLNPALETSVMPGAVLYYIADERIGHLSWESLHV